VVQPFDAQLIVVHYLDSHRKHSLEVLGYKELVDDEALVALLSLLQQSPLQQQLQEEVQV